MARSEPADLPSAVGHRTVYFLPHIIGWGVSPGLDEKFLISFVLEKCAVLQTSPGHNDWFIWPGIASQQYFIFLKFPSAPPNHYLLDSSPESSILVLSVIYITTFRIKQLTNICGAIMMHQPEIIMYSDRAYVLGVNNMLMKALQGSSWAQHLIKGH